MTSNQNVACSNPAQGTVKIGDLIKVYQVLHPGVHPVGIVLNILSYGSVSGITYWLECLWMDGDYENIELSDDFEVISESR